jgi:antirestriction protein ArdC
MPRPAPAHKSFTDRNSLYQEITDKIIAELEQGRVPWVQPWGNSTGPLGTPRNAATQRPYSGINILILWMACTERGFTGQNWLTFRQALKIGAHVRKGEKGTTVVYADRFVPYRERTRAADTGDEPEAIPFLKRFTVFNADQCEDLPADIAPPPSLAPRENLVLPQAEALIRATGADIRIGGNSAFYVPSADYIQVPPPSSYFEPINWHRTVCHELGHYAVSRIMPHGRALRRANLFRAMRRFGIIEPSGNDEVWREADWRLQEFVFDCRHRRALASLRATSQRTRQRRPPAPRTRRVWAEKT